jgi:tRNA (guanine26-N2/guanine27-N2)-dimethyltransferase
LLRAASSYSILREGKAEILQRDNDVFYNKAQVRPRCRRWIRVARAPGRALRPAAARAAAAAPWHARAPRARRAHAPRSRAHRCAPPQVVNRDLSIAVLRLFEQRRHEEAAAGTAPKPWRLRHNTMGALDLNSPLVPLLVHPPELLEQLRASVAAANEEAEADLPYEEEEEEAEEAAGEEGAAAAAEGEEGGAGAAAEGADGDAAGDAAEEGAPAARKPQPPPGPLRILEGLAASGLRSFRYALEVPNVGVVVSNDLDPMAAAAIRRNKAFGGAAVAAVHAHQGDARVVMLTHEKLFDVVDVDPYGTPCTLLDAAVQAVAEGGLLAVTATDMAVLCGNASEVCWTKYGSYPVKIKACHELALRTLLASIQAAAVRHKRHIVPMLSVSIDFYVRCAFVLRCALQSASALASRCVVRQK